MNRYSGLLVVVIGIVALITVLALLASRSDEYTVETSQSSEIFEASAPSGRLPDFFASQARMTASAEFNLGDALSSSESHSLGNVSVAVNSQQAGPSIDKFPVSRESASETLDMEFEVRGSDDASNWASLDDEGAWEFSLTGYRDPGVSYVSATHKEIQEYIGFMTYGTNVADNYHKLVEALPGALIEDEFVSEVWGNEFFELHTFGLGGDESYQQFVTLTLLSEPRTNIFFTYSRYADGNDGHGVQVYHLGDLGGVASVDLGMTKDQWPVLVLRSADGQEGALVLVGDRDGLPALLSIWRIDGFFTTPEYGLMTVGDAACVVTVDRGENLSVAYENGERYEKGTPFWVAFPG